MQACPNAARHMDWKPPPLVKGTSATRTGLE
eukprot:CAMPEP_0178661350 /NCGR_PEP_ID=MMETSP0698-20121128/27646_1 /TAXON_ID=265572 /ORGANISM="Extubocellulus spinifer, Strain CCMP396" /LENGTH=30 /DNA_ID= /DNA_START= /DNA_END= /DNA_ORIENTATION=